MKAFSIALKFDTPQSGVIPIGASTKEEAIQKIKAICVGYSNVEIIDVVEVPIEVLAPRDNMIIVGSDEPEVIN